MIKDGHIERLLRRALYTPLDWQLLRLRPRPLLLVNRTSRRLPWRIIVAVDPHGEPKQATQDNLIERGAQTLAEPCHAELHLAHACNEQLSAPVGGDGSTSLLPLRVRELLRSSRPKAFPRHGSMQRAGSKTDEIPAMMLASDMQHQPHVQRTDHATS